MDVPDDLIQIHDLPPALLEDAHRQIRNFSTCFVIGNALAGSGTFVRVGGVAGILTARHVWEHVVEGARAVGEIGLLIADSAFTLPVGTLVPTVNVESQSSDLGPDLEFVELPRAKLGEIEARKSFLNLSLNPEERLVDAENERGLLLIAGFPENRMSVRDDVTTRRRSHVFYNLGVIVKKEAAEERGGFDYWDLDTGPSESPKDYRGVSGGGVWKVIFAKKIGAPARDAFVSTYCLCGVAFYQKNMRGNSRSIRAHGPRSIYRAMPHILKGKA